MKLSNLYRIGTPILVIILTLSVLVGCAYDAVANQNTEEINTIEPEELIQIEQEWDAVLHNENHDVAKITISSRIQQPMYSSSINPSSLITVEDAEEIKLVIDYFSAQETTYNSMPSSLEDMQAYLNTRYGKKVIKIKFYDSQGKGIMEFSVYEDHVGELMYDPEILDETSCKWKQCRLSFSGEIFTSLEVLCRGFEK